ncbi:MAG: LytTR family DNA-binding domain-containing protein [Oscillospiraceae bacterium]
MKFTIEQSLENNDVEITIKCNIIDDRLQHIIDHIRLYSFSVPAQKRGIELFVPMQNVFYFESVDEKSFLYTKDDTYDIQLKLYELEEMLGKTGFVRISKSCIVNTAYVNHVRSLLNGKFEATLQNEEKLIVNRHYVPAFKQKFGI